MQILPNRLKYINTLQMLTYYFFMVNEKHPKRGMIGDIVVVIIIGKDLPIILTFIE